MLVLQAILSLAALVQLWRTQMLPVLYLVIITALLVLLWLLVRKCLASQRCRRGPGAVRPALRRAGRGTYV